MPFKQIDTVIKWANPLMLCFLDIQGDTPLRQVNIFHPCSFSIDPFSMKTEEVPGKKIEPLTMINDAIDILLVRETTLPPKVLLLHRFTKEW
jgi:hypothetical protein